MTVPAPAVKEVPKKVAEVKKEVPPKEVPKVEQKMPAEVEEKLEEKNEEPAEVERQVGTETNAQPLANAAAPTPAAPAMPHPAVNRPTTGLPQAKAKPPTGIPTAAAPQPKGAQADGQPATRGRLLMVNGPRAGSAAAAGGVSLTLVAQIHANIPNRLRVVQAALQRPNNCTQKDKSRRSQPVNSRLATNHGRREEVPEMLGEVRHHNHR